MRSETNIAASDGANYFFRFESGQNFIVRQAGMPKGDDARPLRRIVRGDDMISFAGQLSSRISGKGQDSAFNRIEAQ